jgi:pyrimidine-specific ribonucleoside hydrolase
MYPLDVFRRVVVSAREAEALAASEDPGTRLAGLLARHQARRFGAAGARIGDAGAVLSVVRPEALVTRPDPRWPRVGVAVDMEDRAAAVYRRLFLDTLRGG